MITYAQNKKAKFEYEWLDTFEVGIVLEGAEVKSIRANKISLKESYVKIKNSEVWLTQAHIPVPDYVPQYARFNEVQDRKLLMHKSEIIKLKSKLDTKGLTLLIVNVYQPKNSKKIKCTLVLARGRKIFQKKQYLKEKSIEKDMQRQISNL